MPTTFANTINGNPIYAARAEADKDGNRIDTTYAKLSDIPAGVTVDQTYDSSSTNAQSGTAVAGAIAGVNQVPASTSSDEDKVLTVDSNGDPVWAPAQGGPQVQADWTETDTSDPSYIQNKPTIPAAQVNADWTASSGVAEILHKPTIPSATSDLTNDSGYITSSDVPSSQEQADWNETDSSDPAYIKNKPSIPSAVTVDQTYNSSSANPQSGTAVAGAIAGVNQVPVSTSSDEYKVLTVNSSGNPVWAPAQGGAQVQSDWTETDTSDPSYIQHKPTEKSLVAGANVSITDGVSSITIAATDTTYTAGSGLNLNNGEFSVNVGSGLAVTSNGLSVSADQTYDSSSTNAQSGVAVAGALATVNQVPASTSSDEDKVLTVNSSGTPVWRTPSGGGGGSGVQADWTEADSTDPSYIQNKPTEKPIVPGNGIAMSEDANSISISANPATLSSAQLLAISRALGVDETVLYDCSSNYTYGTNSVTLSESYRNFEIIKILNSKGTVQFYYPGNSQGVAKLALTQTTEAYLWIIPWTFTSDTVFAGATGKLWGVGMTGATDIPNNAVSNRWIQPIKIIGVHRIAGGN